jgi:hypothetical protein
MRLDPRLLRPKEDLLPAYPQLQKKVPKELGGLTMRLAVLALAAAARSRRQSMDR